MQIIIIIMMMMLLLVMVMVVTVKIMMIILIIIITIIVIVVKTTFIQNYINNTFRATFLQRITATVTRKKYECTKRLDKLLDGPAELNKWCFFILMKLLFSIFII